MMRILICIFMACGYGAIAFADTVYVRSGRGEEQVLVKDVLVTNTWPGDKGLNAVSFYFWHSRNQILTERRVDAREGESFRVEKSGPEEKQRILFSFFESGISGSIYGVVGDVQELFCLRSHYVRRGVRYIGVKDPEDDTTLEIVPSGTNRVDKLDFSDLTRVEFGKKKAMKAVRKDGGTISGEFHDFDFDVYLKGLDKKGKDVQILFSDVVKIEFSASKTGK